MTVFNFMGGGGTLGGNPDQIEWYYGSELSGKVDDYVYSVAFPNGYNSNYSKAIRITNYTVNNELISPLNIYWGYNSGLIQDYSMIPLKIFLPNAKLIALSTFGGYSYSAYSLSSYLTEISVPNIESLPNWFCYNYGKLSSVYIPKITYIPSSAFYNCVNLNPINLENVKEIGIGAFYNNSKIINLNLPQCEMLRGSCFNNCQNLKEVIAPELTTISEGADTFSNCYNLSSISMPKLTSISGTYTFGQCSSLTSINFPNLVSAGSRPFINCVNISSIVMPKVNQIDDGTSSNYWGVFASMSASNLTYLSFDNLERIWSNTFTYFSKISTIYAPNLTEIGDWAFRGWTSLTSAVFPKVITVGSGAFSECRNLSLISLYSANTIGSSAFYYCTSLTSVYLNNFDGTAYSTWFGTYCSNLKLISMPKVTSLPQYMFSGLKITSVYIPLVTEFPNYCFQQATSLTSFSHDSVTIIRQYCFYGCTKLTSVRFSELSQVGLSAFNGCTQLSYIYMPKLTSILSFAFSNIATSFTLDLRSVSTVTSAPTTWNSVFYNAIPQSIYVPSSLYQSFRTAYPWRTYSNKIISV